MPPVRIAVIDSGCDSGFAEESEGVSLFDESDPWTPAERTGARDLTGHGTRCVRIIKTLAPAATIVPVRIFFDRPESSPAVLLAALRWVLRKKFDLVNLSVATNERALRDPLYACCDALWREGAIIVAAGANGTDDGYPAVFDNAIGVCSDHRAKYRDPIRRLEHTLDFAVGPLWATTILSVLGERIVRANSWATAACTGTIAAFIERTGQADLASIRANLEAFSGTFLRSPEIVRQRAAAAIQAQES